MASTCSNSACGDGSALEGFATFNPVTHAFGAIVQANYAEAFALNAATNTIVDASDSDNTGAIGVVDISKSRTCTLTDAGIGGDNDGASTDSTTNVTVVSNEDGTASVINLNGSTSTPATGTPCTLNEGGTPPNSVLLSGLPGRTAGSAVDGNLHQAFLIEDGDHGVTLVQLPSTSKTQLTAGDIPTPSISTIPDTPFNAKWATKGDPYAVAVCKNRGYAVDRSFRFVVQVDLPTLKNNPSVISTDVPAGNCKGTASTLSCKNGHGVVFFPLPTLE